MKQQRIEKEVIGGTVYTVIAEESENAKYTQLDIISQLINRHSNEVLNSTNLLFAANGGKKEC